MLDGLRTKEDCINRKPNIGLFAKAHLKYKIDKSRSYMIGDRDIDVLAGKRFGVKTVLVARLEERHNEDFFANDITSAINWIIMDSNK